MKCQECGQNTATVHTITETNGERRDRFLCISCAQKEALGANITIHDIIKAFMGLSGGQQETAAPESEQASCARCGVTLAEVMKTGRVGCARCWEEFRPWLEPTLRRVHGSVTHAGKLPSKARDPEALKHQQIAKLKQQMVGCITREEFEEAARLRDEIRSLEKGGEQA